MTPETIVDMFQHTMHVVLSIMAVVMLPGLVVGFFISVLQAATQITEQSLSMIPKLFITFITLSLAAPWIMQNLIELYEYAMTMVTMVVS